MKHICAISVLLLLLVYLCPAQQTRLKGENINGDLKSWTIENSLSARLFKTAGNYETSIFPSPDGKYFYFVERSADLQTDCNINKFKIFSSKEVLSALSNKKNGNNSYVKPIKTVTISTGLYIPFGNSIGWTGDSKSILFEAASAIEGNDIKDTSTLYLLAISDSLKIINSINLGTALSRKISYCSKDGSIIIFSLNRATEKQLPQYKYPEVAITEMDLPKVFLEYGYGGSKTINYLYNNGKISELSEVEEKRITDSLLKADALSKLKEPKLPEGLKVFVRQDMNTPPMVVASNGKNEIYLTEPDFSLEDVYIAPTKAIKWKVADGREFTGGLTLPRGYDKKIPLPLVIQNYTFEPNLFQPDGVTTSGYATQTLVANGFAVLQVGLTLNDLIDKYGISKLSGHLSEEGSDFVEKMDAIVNMLGDSGLVDINKVGLIGFSRGGNEVAYAVANPGKIKLAADIVIDGLVLSFGDYLTNSFFNKVFEEVYKGSFWENKMEWLKREPIFNVDRVTAPLLLSTHCLSPQAINQAVYSYTDLISAFRMNKKPIEFLVYPKGLHSLYRPRERYAAMTSTIDWMNFWLKGIEDSNAAKAEKYERWRGLRKTQEIELKEKQKVKI